MVYMYILGGGWVGWFGLGLIIYFLHRGDQVLYEVLRILLYY